MTRPTRAQVAQIAERQPELLDPLVAVFVFGWRRVYTSTRPFQGLDEVGAVRIVPRYHRQWGVDRAAGTLLDVLGAQGDPWHLLIFGSS